MLVDLFVPLPTKKKLNIKRDVCNTNPVYCHASAAYMLLPGSSLNAFKYFLRNHIENTNVIIENITPTIYNTLSPDVLSDDTI